MNERNRNSFPPTLRPCFPLGLGFKSHSSEVLEREIESLLKKLSSVNFAMADVASGNAGVPYLQWGPQ